MKRRGRGSGRAANDFDHDVLGDTLAEGDAHAADLAEQGALAGDLFDHGRLAKAHLAQALADFGRAMEGMDAPRRPSGHGGKGHTRTLQA